jgi:hypothetical protein
MSDTPQHPELQVYAGRKYKSLTTGYVGVAQTVVYQYDGEWNAFLVADFRPDVKSQLGEWTNSAGGVEENSG